MTLMNSFVDSDTTEYQDEMTATATTVANHPGLPSRGGRLHNHTLAPPTTSKHGRSASLPLVIVLPLGAVVLIGALLAYAVLRKKKSLPPRGMCSFTEVSSNESYGTASIATVERSLRTVKGPTKDMHGDLRHGACGIGVDNPTYWSSGSYESKTIVCYDEISNLPGPPRVMKEEKSGQFVGRDSMVLPIMESSKYEYVAVETHTRPPPGNPPSGANPTETTENIYSEIR